MKSATSTEGNALHPTVQGMIDKPGIYVCSNRGNSETCIVIYSMNRKLIVMEMDKELDPTRFHPEIEVRHGPLLP